VRFCLALLGGSFDPVHDGHVALAELFVRLLDPDELRIMPAGQPWQKSGLQASDADRVAMLKLAFDNAASHEGTAARAPAAVIDTREVDRDTPTYTVETLRELRAELGPDASIVFLMGADQLQKLDSWVEWESLFELTNFGVAARPGYRLDAAALPPAVASALAQRFATPGEVRASQAGRVCVAHTLAVDISATEVRAALRADAKNVNALLAPQVLDYIQQHNLYKS
jgi:nicotinate-nucleotide adenylyltransferase